MKFVKLLGGVAALSAMLSGCVVDGGGGLLDVTAGVRVPVGGHRDNGRHEGDREYRRHDNGRHEGEYRRHRDDD